MVLCPMLLWSWLSLIHGKAKYETKLSCTVIYAKRGDKILLSLFSEIRLSKPKIVITVKLCKRCVYSKFSIWSCQSLLKQQKSVLSVKKENKVWSMSDLKGVLMLVPAPLHPPPPYALSPWIHFYIFVPYGDTPK